MDPGHGEVLGISLRKATLEDAEEIHAMQIRAFRPLLEKYQDLDTNPGNEGLDRVIERIGQEATDYYLVKNGRRSVGAVRVVRMRNGERCRISPIFILPRFQNRGFAQQVFSEIERLYAPVQGWELDTILEEPGNCHLYEKLGYSRTGVSRKISDRMTLVSYEKR